MNDSKWWAYIREVAGDAQLKEIADRVGIDKSNVTRWKNGARPAADFAVSFARAYGRPVVEALVAGSYITETEADLRSVAVGVEDLQEVALARELLVRLERRHPEVPHFRAVTRHPSEHLHHQDELTPHRTTTSPRGNNLTAEEAAELLQQHRYATDERDGLDDEQEVDPRP